MMFGLPLDAWLLLGVAVGVGLGVEVAFWTARRGDPRRAPPASSSPRNGAAPPTSPASPGTSP